MAARGGSTRSASRPSRERAPPPQRGRLDVVQTPLRWFAAHSRLSAALLLALPVLICLWPALVGGEIVSPISILYIITPWKNFAPSDLHNYYNYLTADVPWAIYPWREFAREAFRSGHIPTWNPQVLGGVPFYSNPQNGMFTPFNFPLWIFSLNYGLNLSAALKLWAGGFGTYLLVRELRLGFLPGLLAGVAFAFCSLNVTWLLPETLPAVAVMLPWMLWLIERIFRRGGGTRTAVGLALVTAIALGGGHPGTQVHVMFAAGLYVLLRTATASGDEASARWRALALSGAGLVLGAMLMGFMLIPEALSSHGTVGTVARQGGKGSLPGTKMPFSMIRTVLFPDWWGRPSAYETAQPQMLIGTNGTIAINFLERTFYAGVVTCLLAGVAVLWRDAWRRMAPFAVLGFLGLALPLHALGLRWLVDHLPVLELVQNQRFHFVFELSLAVLAAFGLQTLLERPSEERWRFLVPGIAVVVGVVALSSAGAQPGDVGRVFKHFLTGADYERNGVVRLTSAAWFVLFAAGVAAALAALWRWPHRSVAIAGVLVALTAADMLHFANGFNPMAPASKIIPPTTPAIDYLQRHRGDGRILGLGLSLSTDWSMRYGLDDIRGYDPPYPTQRFFELWRLANPEQVDWKPVNIDGLNAPLLKIASAMGVRYVIGDPGIEVPRELRSALRRVYAGKDATVFRNADAVPRAMVASRVSVVGGEEQARIALTEDDADPERVPVVERGESGVADLSTAGSRSGSANVRAGTVTVVSDQPGRVTLRVSMKRRALVVLNDQLTDGWSVKVDGHDADVVRVNQVMRGVMVVGGHHEVTWRYSVPGLRPGLLLTLLAAALLVGAFVIRPRTRIRFHT